jgi:hypothetical protein
LESLIIYPIVGDDRIHLQAASGRLLVRPNATLAGVGILRRDYEACAVVGLVVDLAAADADPPRAYLGLFLFLSSPRFARRGWPAPKARPRASTLFELSLISL